MSNNQEKTKEEEIKEIALMAYGAALGISVDSFDECEILDEKKWMSVAEAFYKMLANESDESYRRGCADERYQQMIIQRQAVENEYNNGYQDGFAEADRIRRAGLRK